MSPSRNGWRLVTVSSRPVIVFSLERVKNKKMCAFFHTSCTVSKRRGGGEANQSLIDRLLSQRRVEGAAGAAKQQQRTSHIYHFLYRRELLLV